MEHHDQIQQLQSLIHSLPGIIGKSVNLRTVKAKARVEVDCLLHLIS